MAFISALMFTIGMRFVSNLHDNGPLLMIKLFRTKEMTATFWMKSSSLMMVVNILFPKPSQILHLQEILPSKESI